MFQKVICAVFVRLDVRGQQVFLCFFVYWQSDLDVPCSNVTLDKFNCKTYIISCEPGSVVGIATA